MVHISRCGLDIECPVLGWDEYKIEHYFGISKKCRRIRTRFDVYMRHYVAFWYMSNVRRMMVVLSEKLSSTEFDELMPLID